MRVFLYNLACLLAFSVAAFASDTFASCDSAFDVPGSVDQPKTLRDVALSRYPVQHRKDPRLEEGAFINILVYANNKKGLNKAVSDFREIGVPLRLLMTTGQHGRQVEVFSEDGKIRKFGLHDFQASGFNAVIIIKGTDESTGKTIYYKYEIAIDPDSPADFSDPLTDLKVYRKTRWFWRRE